MPRILKRPMFSRGGSTNKNDGIMTGLVDRKGFENGTKDPSEVVAGMDNELNPSKLDQMLGIFKGGVPNIQQGEDLINIIQDYKYGKSFPNEEIGTMTDKSGFQVIPKPDRPSMSIEETIDAMEAAWDKFVEEGDNPITQSLDGKIGGYNFNDMGIFDREDIRRRIELGFDSAKGPESSEGIMRTTAAGGGRIGYAEGPTQAEIYAKEYYDQLSKIQPPKSRLNLGKVGLKLAAGKYSGGDLISTLAGAGSDIYDDYTTKDDVRRNLDYKTKMASAKMGISKADAEAIAKAKALATAKKGFRTLTVPEAQSVLKTTYNPQKTYQINLDNGKITPISGTGTTVNITNQKETEEEKELGRVFGKEYSEIITQGNLANINDQKLEILASVNESEDLKLGKLSEFRTEVQKLAETFGFDPELQDTTTAEIVTGISGGLVLDGLQKFVGAISDGERAFVKDITPGLSMSKEGNQYLIQIAKRQNELARGYSEFASEWISRNKGLSKNDTETGMSWGKAKVQWHKNNPLINPELKDQLNTLSKQVGSEFTTNIIPREGKNYIYHYGVGFTIDAEGNKIKNKGYYTELK